MITFAETNLDPRILSAVAEMGYTELTPIQQQVIPFLLENKEGRDLIAMAQTGTGKTAAFGLPMVNLIGSDLAYIQCMVLCPTRELCIQIAGDFEQYAKFNKKLSITPVYGGSNIQEQIRAIKKGTQIVVGTPGRVLDLIRRRQLDLSYLKWLVLDEADEMLNMGFKEELDAILSETPAEKQTLLFSATMPPKISEIAEKYLKNPFEISVAKKNSGAANVSHEYYVVQSQQRYLVLKRLADMHPDIYGIVFCRTRAETQEVAEQLIAEGYNAEAIHGDLTQTQRSLVMTRFRSKKLQILVATDVAARGVDVDDLTHIINYKLPDDAEVYVHRSGRTGRAGKSGVSISLLTVKDKYRIRSLEKMIGKEFVQKRIPSGTEICERQLFHLIEKIKEVKIDEAQIGQFLPGISEKLAGLDREELIKHFVSFEFNLFLAYYKNAPDLNGAPEKRRLKDSVMPQASVKNFHGSSYSGFYLNTGVRMNMTPRRLIELINEQTQNRDIKIGRIKILKQATWFEIQSGHEDELVQAFEHAKYQGEKLMLKAAAEAPTSQPPMHSKRKPGPGDFKKRDKNPTFKKKKK